MPDDEYDKRSFEDAYRLPRKVTDDPAEYVGRLKKLNEDSEAIDRLKAFMRGHEGARPGDTFTMDEGFTAEQLAAASQSLVDDLNAEEREQRHLSHIAPKYRGPEHDKDDVAVTFRRDAEQGGFKVTSEALIGEHHIDADKLPIQAQWAMAQASGKPPMIRPTTVPEARIEMFDMALDIHRADPFPNNPDYTRKSLEWIAETLVDAPLYWVSPEMCQLLQHAAPLLPPTTLVPELLPSESGVVFFAEALEGQDAQTEGHTVHVSALVWGPCEFDVVDAAHGRPETPPDAWGNPLIITEEEGTEEDFIEKHGLVPGNEFRFKGNGTSISTWRKWERWLPLGRTDWPNGFDTEGEFAPPNFTQVQLASIIEDRRWLAAFAILSQQTNVTHTRVVETEKYAAKRLRRRKITPPKVRLVDIHKPKSAPSGQTRDVHWTKRWLVRGHWRQQAYGPGRTLRRPLYIQPFVKGPEDMPLEVSPEIVKVWRR
jgi:hypothetical protein